MALRLLYHRFTCFFRRDWESQALAITAANSRPSIHRTYSNALVINRASGIMALKCNRTRPNPPTGKVLSPRPICRLCPLGDKLPIDLDGNGGPLDQNVFREPFIVFGDLLSVIL